MPFVADVAPSESTGHFEPDPEGRYGTGTWDALVSGYQSSATGLFLRGRLPDVELDRSHATWYEKALEGISGTVFDVPEMAAGAVAGSAAGGTVGSVVPIVGTAAGAAVGAGAGSLAVPAAIRESLVRAYLNGEARSSADWLSRAGIVIKGLSDPEVLKVTGKAAIVGGFTFGSARIAGRALGPALGESVMAGRISAGTARAGYEAGKLGTEVGALTVTPAALEGRLPEPDDFVNAGIVLGGMKVAGRVAGRLSQVYAKTGVTPEQVVADAKADPEIVKDLIAGAEPAKVVPEPDTMEGRLANPDIQAELRAMQGETGWAQVGGRLLRETDESLPIGMIGGAGKVIGRTTWIPNADWWPGRPKGLTEAETKAAIDKALAGEELNAGEQRFIDYATQIAEENIRSADHAPLAEELKESGLEPKDALDVAMVARASEIDEAAVERLAVQHGDNDAGFMLGIKEMLNDFDQVAKIADSGEKGAGAPAEKTDIPRAYQAAAVADAVRNGVPDAASDPSHALNLAAVMAKPIGEVPADKTPNFLNFKYIDEPDDVKGYSARISEIFRQEIETARGKESWDETREKAVKVIADWARETGKPVTIPQDSAAFKDLAAKQMASIAMTQRAAYDIKEAARRVETDGATPENVQAQIVAIENARLIQAVDQGNAAEIARAQNARKAATQVKALTDQYLLMRERYGADPLTLARMIGSLDTSQKISRFANGVEVLNNWQKLQQVYRFSLLSGATVFQVKGIGDMSALAERILQRYLAAAVSNVPLLGSGKATFGEANAMLSATWQGVRDGVDAMVSTWRAANGLRGPNNAFGFAPTFGISEGKAPAAGSAADIANRVLAFPHRVIAAETELFRVLNERGEMGRLAHNQAVSEGFARGTDNYNARLTEILRAPSKDMIAAAKLAGDEGTFTQKLGEIGQILQTISRNDLGGFVVPFAKVPANLAKWAVKDAPLIANLSSEVRADWAEGGRKRDMVIARQLIGATVATLAVEGALKGMLTGGAQWMTPQQKQARIDAGIQDYSFKFPWSDEWHSFNRYQPLGTIAMVAADMTEIFQHAAEDDRADVLKMLAAVIGHATISQPYFEGVHQFMQSLTSPTEGARYYDNFIASWVPSFLAQTASSLDPQKRRVDSLMDAVQARIPIWREQLLPQINTLTGQPLPNTHGLFVSQSMEESQDPVLTEAVRLGVGAGRAPKSITIPAGGVRGLGKIELTPEQQNLFSTVAGQVAHRVMEKFVNSDEWDVRPDIIKKHMYELAIAEAHSMGAAVALSPEQRQEEARKIARTIMEKVQ